MPPASAPPRDSGRQDRREIGDDNGAVAGAHGRPVPTSCVRVFLALLPTLLLLLFPILPSLFPRIPPLATRSLSHLTTNLRIDSPVSPLSPHCVVAPVAPLRLSQRPSNVTHARRTVFLTDGSNFDDILTLLYLLKSPHLTPVAIYIGANAWANAAPSRRIFRDLLTLFGEPYASIPILIGSFFALADEQAAQDDGLPHVVTPRYRAPVPHGRAGILRCDDAFGTARHLPAAHPGADTSDLDFPSSSGSNSNNRTPAAEDDAAALHALSTTLQGLPDASTLFLATGTLTPVAKLLLATNHADPGIAAAASKVIRKIADVVVMGGAVHARGNVYTLPANDHAEFNIFNDPHAAHVALRGLAERGKPATLVPLDATAHVPFTRSFCHALERARGAVRVAQEEGEEDHGLEGPDVGGGEMPTTPELQYAALLVRRLRESWEGEAKFFEAAYLWDVTAAVVAARPGVVSKSSTLDLRVVTDQGVLGPQQGWTKPCDDAESADGQCYAVRVVLAVDGHEVRQEVLARLRSGVNSAVRSLVCG